MPHAVLNQKIDLRVFSDSFEQIINKNGCLVKIQDVFVDKNKRMALLPAVVIDEKNQQFLIEVSTRDEKTTVRLFPGTDPEKTPGVKKSLGLIVRRIQENFTDAKVIKTNIQDYL